MQQTFLTRHELHEASVRHERFDHSVVLLANLRQSDDGFDLRDSRLHCLTVVGSHFHLAAFLVLVNRDNGTCLGLDRLDNLAAGTNNCANEVFRNIEGSDARSVRLEVRTRSRHRLQNLIQDEHTGLVSLCQSVLKDFVAQTIDLDIHLASGQTVTGTGGLEVHIAKVVFVTKDVTQNGVVRAFVLGNKSHSNTRDHSLNWDTSGHK